MGPLAGLAAGGAVLGHALAYALVFPGASERHAHLAATGHGAFHLVAVAVCPVVGVALFALCLRAVRARPLPSVGGTAAALAALQSALFLLAESAERGFDLVPIASDPAVRLGLLLQVVLAVALAFVLSLLERTVRLVAARIRRDDLRAPAGPSPRPAATELSLRPEDRLSTAPRRAPPALSGG